MKKGLTYDDVLIVPEYSDVLPDNVDTSFAPLGLKIPILAAAMDTISEEKMAIAMNEIGGNAVIHQNMTTERMVGIVQLLKSLNHLAYCAISIKDIDNTRVQQLLDCGVDALFIDTAHGHSLNVLNATKIIKELIIKHQYKTKLVAGNIATGRAALDLINHGADGLKIGNGPGSICSTRGVTGVGVPQLTAVMDVCEAVKSYVGIFTIADGGIKSSADIVKALAAKADLVMIGRLIAGTDECPGEMFEKDGIKYKEYRGMGSVSAMKNGSKERYNRDDVSMKLAPEGVEAKVIYQPGGVKNIIANLVHGLKQGMGSTGSHNLAELKDSQFIEMTHNGILESNPHSIILK